MPEASQCYQPQTQGEGNANELYNSMLPERALLLAGLLGGLRWAPWQDMPALRR